MHTRIVREKAQVFRLNDRDLTFKNLTACHFKVSANRIHKNVSFLLYKIETKIIASVFVTLCARLTISWQSWVTSIVLKSRLFKTNCLSLYGYQMWPLRGHQMWPLLVTY
jgi:hypothetical protein